MAERWLLTIISAGPSVLADKPTEGVGNILPLWSPDSTRVGSSLMRRARTTTTSRPSAQMERVFSTSRRMI